MLCKYCGEQLKSSTICSNVPALVGRFGSQKCWQSSNGKHIACSGTTMVCKYCGTTLKSTTMCSNVPVLGGQRGGTKCPQSPHGKHELVE